MRLSIIVPVYNMASDNKLTYCMDALLHQTIQDYEIIAVDDASTDNSLEILNEYAKQNPDKVRVLKLLQNKRQGGAKNEGLKVAKGEWIGFIDSDDWITPDYYEKLLDKAEKTGADLVGCDYSLVYSHTMEVGKVIENNTEDQIGKLDHEKHASLFLRPGSMVLKIYKHSVIKEHVLSFPEGIFYEDNCAGPLWTLYFAHFEKVKEPMYYYYQHTISTVHHITEEKCKDRMKAALLLLEECKNRGFLDTSSSNSYKTEIEYRFTELYYVNTLFSYMSGVAKPKSSFVKELKKGIQTNCPLFQENTFYQKWTGEEEKKLIQMQMKSNMLFFYYYRLKLFVRSKRT